MNLTIVPGKLCGTVTPPPSKSQAHRLLLAAALAEGESTLSNMALSQDIEATLRCITALGAQWRETGAGVLTICGTGGRRAAGEELPRLDCGESGSTLRFLIPVALALRGGGVFTGQGRLLDRPQGPYEHLLREKGIAWERGRDCLTVRGALAPGRYALPGDVSSQFFSGLLFALPLLDGDSEIVSTTKLESAGYIHMTRQAQKQFGVESRWEGNTFHVPGRQMYRPCDCAAEADWSQAAFWYAAEGIGNAVTVAGMNRNAIQGDRVILDLGRMIRNEPLAGGVSAPILGERQAEGERRLPTGAAGHGRYAVGIDVSQTPDLVPPLAVWGALTPGCDLYIKNAGRLRMKESDRLSTVTQALSALGARVTEEADRLIIEGQESLPGGAAVPSYNDHRIAMMVAVAATRCRREVTLLGAECVKKSYPNFWEDYQKLGGTIR